MCFTLLISFIYRTSLVVQWLRICLLMQGTWIQSLIQKESTSYGASKLAHHTTETHAPYNPCLASGEATAMRLGAS